MSAVVAPALEFVTMGADDLGEVAAIEAAIYEFPWSRLNFADSLTSGYSAWVCRRGGQMVGYGVMLVVVDEAHLLNLSIRSESQGRGYGRMLLGHLRGVARAHGAASLYLEVRPSNAGALALYRASGFAEVGRRRGYYPARGGREDALVMRSRL